MDARLHFEGAKAGFFGPVVFDKKRKRNNGVKSTTIK